MSYAAKEQGDYTGNPIELFRFSWTGEVRNWTSGDETISYGGEDYEPYPIRRGNLTGGADALKVGVPIDCELKDLLTGNDILSLKIYREHRDDANAIIIFSGRVMGLAGVGDMIELDCHPFLKLLERPMPQHIFQTGCNWRVYDDHCQADPEGLDKLGIDLTQEWALTAVAGRRLTATGLGGYHVGNDPLVEDAYDDYFTAGIAKWTDGDGVEHIRYIMQHFGAAGIGANLRKLGWVDLDYAFPAGCMAGETVTFIAGCKRTATVCDAKFDNVANFGGYPYIPTRNPWREGVVF
jgi:hypothetical protein